jgi:endonuclease/exonuclease/phosphatase family metal-dependent hydrolase
LLHISLKRSDYWLQKASLGLFCCLLMGGCSITEQPSMTTALTFNIRYDNPGDGQDAWPNRSEWVASILDSSGASIVGLQEVLKHQLDDIVARASRFSWVGVGRADGIEGGEFSPVLYDSQVWKMIYSQTRWLSPDSSAIGIAGWDAALPRIATVVDFRNIYTDRPLRVINTHFDHRGEEARFQSARLISRWAAEVEGPVIVMGDLNFEDDTPSYQALLEPDSLSLLIDAASQFEGEKTPTFRGFDAQNTNGPRIDYVFVNDLIVLKSYEVLSPVRRGRFPSDHLPVKVWMSF